MWSLPGPPSPSPSFLARVVGAPEGLAPAPAVPGAPRRERPRGCGRAGCFGHRRARQAAGPRVSLLASKQRETDGRRLGSRITGLEERQQPPGTPRGTPAAAAARPGQSRGCPALPAAEVKLSFPHSFSPTYPRGSDLTLLITYCAEGSGEPSRYGPGFLARRRSPRGFPRSPSAAGGKRQPPPESEEGTYMVTLRGGSPPARSHHPPPLPLALPLAPLPHGLLTKVIAVCPPLFHTRPRTRRPRRPGPRRSAPPPESSSSSSAVIPPSRELPLSAQLGETSGQRGASPLGQGQGQGQGQEQGLPPPRRFLGCADLKQAHLAGGVRSPGGTPRGRRAALGRCRARDSSRGARSLLAASLGSNAQCTSVGGWGKHRQACLRDCGKQTSVLCPRVASAEPKTVKVCRFSLLLG